MKIRETIIVFIVGLFSAANVFGAAQGRELWSNIKVGPSIAIAEDLNNDGVVDIPATDVAMTILISGSNGKETSRVDTLSNSMRFADMDGDGDRDIVLSVQRGGMTQGSVIAINKFSWNTWKTEKELMERETAVSALYDFDGDGIPEILGRMGPNLTLINYKTGKVFWNINSGPIFGGTALADVNGDGRPEIVTYKMLKNENGQYIFRDMYFQYNYDVLLSIIDPITGKDIFQIEQPMGFSSRPPIAADLSGKGSDDVVVFSKDKIYVVRDGEVITRYQHRLNMPVEDAKKILGDKTPPDVLNVDIPVEFKGGAVGNFHSQPGLEIALLTSLDTLMAITPDGKVLWEVPTGAVSGQPVIADVNGDNSQEIIVATEKKGVVGYDGETGKELYSFMSVFIPVQVLVADVNGDGNLDIVAAGRPGIAAWTMDKPGKIEWANESGDAAGTENYKIAGYYAERMANPVAFRKYPYFKVGLGIGIALFLVSGVALAVRHFSSIREAAKASEMSSEMARLEKAFEKNRDDNHTIIALAREYAKNNVMGVRAIEVYRKAVTLAPNDTAIVMAAAKTFLNRKTVNPERERVFQMALGASPKNAEFIESLVRLYLANKQVGPFAMTLYYHFFSAGDFNPDLAKSTAMVLSTAQSKEPFSAWLYQQVLQIDPGNIAILIALLASLKEQNSPNEYLVLATHYIADPRLSKDMRKQIAEDLRAWGMAEDADKFFYHEGPAAS